ncbi:MAG: recombinase family protein [Terriglobia bacterium]
MPQKAIALIRVSSEEQAAEGLAGVERQQRDIAAIAARHNLTIDHMYSLEGVSGSTVRLNSQFQRMLAHVVKPGIAGLVISSPDRLMRCSDLSDLAVLAPFGDSARPRLIWSGESIFDLSKFESQILFLMQTLIAGDEKRKIIARTQAGKDHSRGRGDKCPEKPPKGMEFVITDQKNRTGYYKFTSDASRVKRAFLRVLDRDSSIRSIASELGFGTYQGMRKQLMNPIWTGRRVSAEKRERLPPGPDGQLRHRRVPRITPIRVKINLQGEPLISQEQFDEVQAILGEINKTHVDKRAGKSLFALTGLLYCTCGQRMYSEHESRRTYTGFYVCKSGYLKKSNGCGNPVLNRSEADDRIIGVIASILGSKTRLVELLKRATEPADSALLRDERMSLRAEVEKQIKRKNNIVDRIADGVLSDGDARIKIAQINSEIGRKETRIKEIDRKLKGAQIADVGHVVSAVVSLIAGLQHKPLATRKVVLRSLISEIHLSHDKSVSALRLKIEAGRTVLLSI